MHLVPPVTTATFLKLLCTCFYLSDVSFLLLFFFFNCLLDVYILGLKRNTWTLPCILPSVIILFFVFIPVMRVKRNISDTWRVDSVDLKHRGRIGTPPQTLRVKRALSPKRFTNLSHREEYYQENFPETFGYVQIT